MDKKWLAGKVTMGDVNVYYHCYCGAEINLTLNAEAKMCLTCAEIIPEKARQDARQVRNAVTEAWLIQGGRYSVTMDQKEPRQLDRRLEALYCKDVIARMTLREHLLGRCSLAEALTELSLWQHKQNELLNKAVLETASRSAGPLAVSNVPPGCTVTYRGIDLGQTVACNNGYVNNLPAVGSFIDGREVAGAAQVGNAIVVKFKDEEQAEPVVHACTCPTATLMAGGCQCGGK